MAVTPLSLGAYKEIVILTGAGVSVASGLRPYRGKGGLWEEQGLASIATARTMQEDPGAIWRLFGAMRRDVLAVQPNPAHLALAAAQQRWGQDRRFTLITQNVDGLHQRAGSSDVIELHGALLRTRCSSSSCTSTPFHDEEAHLDTLPACAVCGATLRPDIVLFEEAIPGGEEWRAKRSLRDCDLFLAIGTSGTVSPASSFVRSAEYAGARTVLINLEPMETRNPAFQEEILGPAETLLPLLLDVSELL